MLVELAVEVGEGQQGEHVAGPQPQRLLVRGGGLLQGRFASLALGMGLQHLRQHEMAVGVGGVDPHRRLRLHQGLRGAPRLAQHARELGVQRARPGIDAQRLAVLAERLFDLARQPGLLGRG